MAVPPISPSSSSSFSLPPPRKDKVRKLMFVSEEESSHQKLNQMAPWSWTSRPLGLWVINFCCSRNIAYGTSLWQSEQTHILTVHPTQGLIELHYHCYQLQDYLCNLSLTCFAFIVIILVQLQSTGATSLLCDLRVSTRRGPAHCQHKEIIGWGEACEARPLSCMGIARSAQREGWALDAAHTVSSMYCVFWDVSLKFTISFSYFSIGIPKDKGEKISTPGHSKSVAKVSFINLKFFESLLLDLKNTLGILFSIS